MDNISYLYSGDQKYQDIQRATRHWFECIICTRVALKIRSVIGIGRYWDISTVSVIGIVIVSPYRLRIDDVIILDTCYLRVRMAAKHEFMGVASECQALRYIQHSKEN